MVRRHPATTFNDTTPSQWVTIMNVHDINFGTHRPDQLRKPSVDKTGQPGASARGQAAPEAGTTPAQDRVEISEAARAASAKQNELKREIEFARRALYSIPPLSEDRAEEILKRLKKGEYNAPDVLTKLSQKLSKDLAPRAPEAGEAAE